MLEKALYYILNLCNLYLYRNRLTSFAQLNGNISAICEISKNSIKLVKSNENIAQNTIKRKRPISGNRNRPTCTVPAENSLAKHAADDIYMPQLNNKEIGKFLSKIHVKLIFQIQ